MVPGSKVCGEEEETQGFRGVCLLGHPSVLTLERVMTVGRHDGAL